MATYYYAVAGQRNGPISEEQLDQMVSNGSLAADTLIWTDGMQNWAPYSSIKGTFATQPRAATPPGAATAGAVVCSVCKQIFPPDQVIRYGTEYVCGNCKPIFLQGLREGAQVGGLNFATIGKRFSAKFVDSIIVYIINFGIGSIVPAMIGQGAEPSATMLLGIMAINMAIAMGYPIFFLGKWGQTLGKMAMKIKVTTPDGAPIGYGRATGRVFGELVTGFTFGIGYLIAIWDAERRALHDRLAGTRVISLQPK
jgi:uncharacterized RDD family membrane protein YckC